MKLSPEALAKIRRIAQQRGSTLGEVASELILQALQPEEAPTVRNGGWISPEHDGPAPDLHLVNRLRDQESVPIDWSRRLRG